MTRYPEKFAHVFAAIGSTDGPVLVHCAGGRDRTGLVCSMLLQLTGVEPVAICDHYADGFRRAAGYRGHGMGYDPASGEWVVSAEQERTADELDAAIGERLPAVHEWLATTNVADYLVQAGLDAAQVKRLAEMLRP